MHILKVDTTRCSSCRTCVDVCFVNAIGWDEGEGLPVLTYPEDCQVCCVCERGCPDGAIEIVPDWGGRYCPPYLSTPAGDER